MINKQNQQLTKDEKKSLRKKILKIIQRILGRKKDNPNDVVLTVEEKEVFLRNYCRVIQEVFKNHLKTFSVPRKMVSKIPKRYRRVFQLMSTILGISVAIEGIASLNGFIIEINLLARGIYLTTGLCHIAETIILLGIIINNELPNWKIIGISLGVQILQYLGLYHFVWLKRLLLFRPVCSNTIELIKKFLIPKLIKVKYFVQYLVRRYILRKQYVKFLTTEEVYQELVERYVRKFEAENNRPPTPIVVSQMMEKAFNLSHDPNFRRYFSIRKFVEENRIVAQSLMNPLILNFILLMTQRGKQLLYHLSLALSKQMTSENKISQLKNRILRGMAIALAIMTGLESASELVRLILENYILVKLFYGIMASTHLLLCLGISRGVLDNRRPKRFVLLLIALIQLGQWKIAHFFDSLNMLSYSPALFNFVLIVKILIQSRFFLRQEGSESTEVESEEKQEWNSDEEFHERERAREAQRARDQERARERELAREREVEQSRAKEGQDSSPYNNLPPRTEEEIAKLEENRLVRKAGFERHQAELEAKKAAKQAEALKDASQTTAPVDQCPRDEVFYPPSQESQPQTRYRVR